MPAQASAFVCLMSLSRLKAASRLELGEVHGATFIMVVRRQMLVALERLEAAGWRL